MRRTQKNAIVFAQQLPEIIALSLQVRKKVPPSFQLYHLNGKKLQRRIALNKFTHTSVVAICSRQVVLIKEKDGTLWFPGDTVDHD